MQQSFYVLCCAIAIFFSSCQHKEHKIVEEETVFSVTKPETADTFIYKEYVCQIRSFQHIELRALEKGYLQKILVDEGQFVKKGQLLFQIMPNIYKVEKRKAQAEVHYAETEYRNTKMLSDSNIVSTNELALDKAKLEKANAELAMADTHLGFTEIRAPFDGIVGRFFDVRLGSLVDEGDLLTTLSDNDKMWVYYNVPESQYLSYMSRGKKDFLKVKLMMANNQVFETEGVVETIEADFNNETGNIAFRATFENPKKILRQGQTGKILMPQLLNNTLFIPQKATFEILDKIFVYVVGQDGILESREIKVSSALHHLYAIKEGLSSDEQILLEGLRKVKNGEHIKYKYVNHEEVIDKLNNLQAQ